jgi:hypothetical protein
MKAKVTKKDFETELNQFIAKSELLPLKEKVISTKPKRETKKVHLLLYKDVNYQLELKRCTLIETFECKGMTFDHVTFAGVDYILFNDYFIYKSNKYDFKSLLETSNMNEQKINEFIADYKTKYLCTTQTAN